MRENLPKEMDFIHEAANAKRAVEDFRNIQTSLYIPEVILASKRVLIMEFIEGDCLSDMWEKLNTSQKEQIIEQLRGFVTELRGIKGSFIGSVDGTACEDQLFTDEIGAYGPYKRQCAHTYG